MRAAGIVSPSGRRLANLRAVLGSAVDSPLIAEAVLSSSTAVRSTLTPSAPRMPGRRHHDRNLVRLRVRFAIFHNCACVEALTA